MIVASHTGKADQWLSTIFNAKSARSGGVVRRHRAWVEAEIGRDRFEQEVRRRGFHLIETGQQLIVICNSGNIRLVF